MTRSTRSTNSDAEAESAPARRRVASPPTERIRRARQTRFLNALRDTGTITGASRTSHNSRTSHYRWLQRDPTYAARVAEANDEAADRLDS